MQKKAEEEVKAYFALSAEGKRAYMRVRSHAALHQQAFRTYRVCMASL